MDIGVEEDRDDLYSILLLGQENSNKLTPELIQQKLLIDTPIIACELLVKTLQDLSLIDQNGVITETGKEVLDTKKVPIKEAGVYDIYCVNDLLFNSVFLECKLVEITNIKSEVFAQDNNQNPNLELINLPDWILSTNQRKIFLKKRNQTLHIFEIEPKGHQIRDSKERNTLSLIAELNLNSDGAKQFQFSGYVKGSEQMPDDINFTNVWQILLGQDFPLWEHIPQRGHEAFKVAFEGLNEKELESFTRELKIQKPTLPKYGQFNTTIISNVPIAPLTAKDGQRWYEWFLERKVTNYLFSKQYADYIKTYQQKFPEFKLKPIAREEILQRITLQEKSESKQMNQRHQRKYWYLSAPLDLTLEEE